jgi:hypothetical protein
MDSVQRNVGIMTQTFRDSVSEDFGYVYDVYRCLQMLCEVV